VSRDRTVVPRAVTPRDEVLDRAIAEVRREQPEWHFVEVFGDELKAQGADVETLRKDYEARKSTIRWLKGLVSGSLVTALIAVVAASRAYGRNEGLAEASKAQAAEYRAKVQELDAAREAQALDIARLQEAVHGPARRPPTGTWVVPTRRRTTVPDIEPQGDHEP
jgi:type VI protein secretion system component VasK